MVKIKAYLAIEAGMVETVELMILRGLEGMQLISRDGHTAMHVMADFGDMRMLALAKRSFGDNVDLNARTSRHGHTTCQLACSHGDIDVINFLFAEYPRESFDINYSSIFHDTALKLAASRGHFDVVARLLQEGADVETKGAGPSALFQAAIEEQYEFVKILCEHGAIADSFNGGRSVMHVVAAIGNTALLEYLTEERHADTSERTEDGFTILDTAACCPRKVRAVFDGDEFDFENYFPGSSGEQKHRFALKLSIETVRILLTNGGADFERDFQESSSALRRTALQGNLEIVKLLIEHGAMSTHRSSAYKRKDRTSCSRH